MAEMMTREQQQSIHVIMKHLAPFMGQSIARTRLQLKENFATAMDYDRPFSLKIGRCTLKEYEVFKEYVLDVALEYGMAFDGIKYCFDDLEQYAAMCIKKRVCCVDGVPHDPDNNVIVDIHHSPPIGMGRDRKSIDHSQLPRMALSRKRHQESHKIGLKVFEERYHVVAVKTNYRSGKDAIDDVIDTGEVDE